MGPPQATHYQGVRSSKVWVTVQTSRTEKISGLAHLQTQPNVLELGVPQVCSF